MAAHSAAAPCCRRGVQPADATAPGLSVKFSTAASTPPPRPAQAWFKNVQQLGQRAQGFNKQTFVERSRFLRQGGKWLYGARAAHLWDPCGVGS